MPTSNMQSTSTSLRGTVPIHHIPITAPSPVALSATLIRVEVETCQIHAVYENQPRLVLICGGFKQDYKTVTIYGQVQLDAYRTKPLYILNMTLSSIISLKKSCFVFIGTSLLKISLSQVSLSCPINKDKTKQESERKKVNNNNDDAYCIKNWCSIAWHTRKIRCR